MNTKIIGPNDPALSAAIKNINAHPEWNTELTLIPWAEYRDVLMDSLSADISPNQAVFVPGNVWIPELAAAGLITGLDSLIAHLPEGKWDSYQWEDIIEKVKRESQYSGQKYMIPYFNDAHILFIREDLINLEKSDGLLEISPLDLVDLAEKAHHPPDVFGIALKAHPSEILFDWLPYLLAAGGELADASLKPAFVSEEGILALRTYCKLREFADPDTHTFGNEEIADVLINGKAALVTTWGGQAAPIFLNENNSYRDRYRAAIFPKPCGGTWGITIPSNQKLDVQMHVLEILLELNGPEQDQDVLLAAGSPVRSSTYTETAYSKYSWLRAQREVMNRFHLLPQDPRIVTYFGPLTEAIVNAFQGNKTPEDSLREAETTILKALG
jgi:multiple sugar transport system substrate-binding protein